MQIQRKSILTLLAMVGISAMAVPAKGATIATGDLLVYFRSTGTNTTVVADLGQANVFRDATGAVTGPDLGSLLSTTYGANWYTDGNVSWGFAGGNTNLTGTGLVATDPRLTAYLSIAAGSSAPVVATSATQGLMNTINVGLKQRFQNESGTTPVAGSGPLALSTGLSNTWEDFQTSAPASSFGLNFSAEQTFGSGVSGANLDLYRIVSLNTDGSSVGTNAITSLEGTFSINSSGQVSFAANVGAAPEPSRTLFAGLGLGALLLRRRRRRA